MKVQYQCNSTISGVPWEYNTDMPTPEMALEYGAKLARFFAGCYWFMSLLIWDMDEKKLIGEATIGKPQIHVVKTT